MQTNTNQGNIPEGQNVQTQGFNTVEQSTDILSQEEPKRKNKTLFVFLIIFLVFFLTGALFYVTSHFINMNNLEEQNDSLYESRDLTEVVNEQGGIEEVEVDKEEGLINYSKYLGEYIKGEIPIGWSIIEYENGEEAKMLMEGVEYEGLTGIAILNDLGEEIFSLQGADGLGGLFLCVPEVQFPDTPQEYVDRLISKAENYQSESHVVQQIAPGEFTDFNLFEYRGRRVGSNLYWNDLENTNPNEFHTSCPFPVSDSYVLHFEELSFSYKDGQNLSPSSYQVKLLEGMNEETLLILDYILSSLAVNK